MSFDDIQDRTEQPTERRVRDARQQGNVPRSHALTTAIQLFVAAAALYFLGGQFATSAAAFLHRSLAVAGTSDLSSDTAVDTLTESLQWSGQIAIPFFAALIAVLIVSNVTQAGFRINADRVMPNWEHISPLRGLARFVTLRNCSMIGHVTVSVVACISVVVWFITSQIERIAGMSRMLPAEFLFQTTRMLGELALWVALVLLTLSLFDVLFQRWNHKRQLMMTKEEVREELRTAEVDPQIQNRLADTHRRLSQPERSE